jgi:hypothetical protein
MEAKEVESKKIEETEAVLPPVSKAVALKDLSSDDIAQVIVKKKHRFFDRSKKPEEYTLEELEIIRNQKIEEERLAREKAADEAFLAQLRVEKKGYYDHYRKFFSMDQPVDVRWKNFLKFYEKHRGNLDNKKIMEQIQCWLEELFNLKLVDRKHPLTTDAEMEAFIVRCRDKNISCPFELFAKYRADMFIPTNKEHSLPTSEDRHRLDLIKQV